MAVSVTSLTSGVSATDAASYTTSSYTPTAGRFVLACIYNNESDGGGTPPTPTISGNSLTWTQEVTQVQTFNSSHSRRLTLYRAVASSPTAGALTIDMGGNTQIDCGWIITEWQGLAIGGTNGSRAIVQSAGTAGGNNATSLTVTLAAFEKATNPTFGFMTAGEDVVVTAGSGFTQIAQATSPHTLQAQWKNSSDTSVDWTFPSTNRSVGVALELRPARAGGAFLFNML